jgi:putative oxidoreductase
MAAITVVIAMAVASLIVHAGDPIGTKEKALLFVIGFLAIALMGAGKFSMDRK